MNYLRLLLFFFVLLAPLQITPAWGKNKKFKCYLDCFDRTVESVGVAKLAIKRCEKSCGYKLKFWLGRCSHFDDDHGDDDGNDHKQETPPRLLQDHFMWFQGSFVSQINWQPIGKLLFMINLHASPDRDQVSKSGPFRSHCLGHFRASWWYNNTYNL